MKYKQGIECQRSRDGKALRKFDAVYLWSSCIRMPYTLAPLHFNQRFNSSFFNGSAFLPFEDAPGASSFVKILKLLVVRQLLASSQLSFARFVWLQLPEWRRFQSFLEKNGSWMQVWPSSQVLNFTFWNVGYFELVFWHMCKLLMYSGMGYSVAKILSHKPQVILPYHSE